MPRAVGGAIRYPVIVMRIEAISLLATLGCLSAASAQAPTEVSPRQLELFFSGQAPLAVPAPAPGRRPAPRLTYTIVKTYPHDTSAFTEGLLWHGGHLYESVGIEKQSEVRKVDLGSGSVLQSARSPDNVFGEGLVIVGDRLIQLTYTEGRAFVYDLESLSLVSEFHYSGEGWGLTSDGRSLIMSDGSDALTFRDPATFAPRRRVRVTWDGRPVKALNELEFVGGAVWANIWKDKHILRIDPASGRVTGYLDLAALAPRAALLPEPEEDVLNGIAYDPASGHFFITGKCWPFLYEIKIGG